MNDVKKLPHAHYPSLLPSYYYISILQVPQTYVGMNSFLEVPSTSLKYFILSHTCWTYIELDTLKLQESQE